MMIAGCFGLLAAAADLLPEVGEEIRAIACAVQAGAALRHGMWISCLQRKLPGV